MPVSRFLKAWLSFTLYNLIPQLVSLSYLIDPAEDGDESSGTPLRKRPLSTSSHSSSSLLVAGSRSSGGVGGSPMADVAVEECSRFWLSLQCSDLGEEEPSLSSPLSSSFCVALWSFPIRLVKLKHKSEIWFRELLFFYSAILFVQVSCVHHQTTGIVRSIL